MAPNIDVAVFILNYNTSEHTINCVNSVILKSSINKIHIYVIDNGSNLEDYSRLRVLETNINLTLVRNEKNLGFFGGYRSVIDEGVDAKYYYFLNNDCLLLNDTIGILVNFMEQHSNVGICSGRIFGKSMDFEPCFNHLPTLSRKLFGSKLLGLLYPNKYPNRFKVYEKTLKVETVNGSSFLITKESYDMIGGFDTNYFLYCEEEELGTLMIEKQLDVFSVPQAELQHLGSMSSKKSFATIREYYISLNYFYSKHYSWLYRYVSLGIICVKFFFKGIFKRKYLEVAKFLLTPNKSKYSLRYS